MKAGINGITRVIITAVDPAKDRKWFTSRQYRTVTDNGSSRLVTHFSNNFVPLVTVGVKFFGNGSVDFQFNGAIFGEFDFLLADQFRWIVGSTVPPGHRSHTADPFIPSGIPGVVIAVPPISWPKAPVPSPVGVPVLTVIVSTNRDFDGSFRNWGPKIIVCFHLSFDHFTKSDRLIRSLYGDFILWFLVLFDSESVATGNLVRPDSAYVESVDTQHGILWCLPVKFKTAVFVCFYILGEYFFTSGVMKFQRG